MEDSFYISLDLLNLIDLWKGRLKEAKTESEYIYAKGALEALKQLKNKIDKNIWEFTNK